jgi:16S rRNA (cytosine967-C5)-methyltransferase
MRLAGRIAAAIEILKDIFERHQPASEALKGWGKAHRFAGSSDRHAIGTLVFDCLRRRNSLSARMGDGRPRALVLAALHDLWGQTAEQIGDLVNEAHGPGALSDAEQAALSREMRGDLPAHVAGDLPDWVMPMFEQAFGENAAAEGAALAMRAPVDLRVNTLVVSRPDVLEALGRFGAVEGPLSPLAVRIAPPGWYEIQDAGSQVAALLSGAKPGETVADICAGAGGKTLALAAMMENQGKLVAHDTDRFRLRPIFDRLTRAGVTNCEVLSAQDGDKLDAAGPFDCVLVDAPCSGSGAWRRKPDAKWRITEKQLGIRITEQTQVLEKSAKLVKPGGRIVYITCSLLPAENGEQIAAFLADHGDFKIIPYAEQWRQSIGGDAPRSADGSTDTLLLTPAQHGTDGFFVAVLRKAA